MKRIVITDNSTGKTYCPRQTTIDKLINKEFEYIGHKELTIENLVNAAIEKWYGKGCWFFRNHELRDCGILGQVVESAPTGGMNCVTPRIAIFVKVNGVNVISNTELNEVLKGE